MKKILISALILIAGITANAQKVLQGFEASATDTTLTILYKNSGRVVAIKYKIMSLPMEDAIAIMNNSDVVSDRLPEAVHFKSVLAQITPEMSLSEERMLIYNQENSDIVFTNISSLRKRPTSTSEYDAYEKVKEICEKLIK